MFFDCPSTYILLSTHSGNHLQYWRIFPDSREKRYTHQNLKKKNTRNTGAKKQTFGEGETLLGRGRESHQVRLLAPYCKINLLRDHQWSCSSKIFKFLLFDDLWLSKIYFQGINFTLVYLGHAFCHASRPNYSHPSSYAPIYAAFWNLFTDICTSCRGYRKSLTEDEVLVACSVSDLVE